ncbi:hypothetical protein PPIS_b1389 [Pseudoalteromonas piscicida]|uniref:Uncharacterized protein n=1 Tax=Pseudoalteromonas piscicida TaxID=43662 RepID=A0ABM6NNQ9_PSEO7|nr:hypothetical protein PPIS_b1389 [Pseudoalteromonas piscicida]
MTLIYKKEYHREDFTENTSYKLLINMKSPLNLKINQEAEN